MAAGQGSTNTTAADRQQSESFVVSKYEQYSTSTQYHFFVSLKHMDKEVKIKS